MKNNININLNYIKLPDYEFYKIILNICNFQIIMCAL